MRWEAIVALYDNIKGTVFINKPGSTNTDNINDDLNYDISNVLYKNNYYKNHIGKVNNPVYYNNDSVSLNQKIPYLYN